MGTPSNQWPKVQLVPIIVRTQFRNLNAAQTQTHVADCGPIVLHFEWNLEARDPAVVRIMAGWIDACTNLNCSLISDGLLSGFVAESAHTRIEVSFSGLIWLSWFLCLLVTRFIRSGLRLKKMWKNGLRQIQLSKKIGAKSMEFRNLYFAELKDLSLVLSKYQHY